MWNHITNMHIWRYWHQSFWNWGLLPSSAEVSGFFKFELHSKGTVLCFWSSLRCIKILISIYCRGFKFPYRAVFLLPLDSIILHKATGDSEQDLQRYWQPECCIYQWYDKPTGYGCLYKKSGLWQQQTSDIPVSRTVAKHSNIKSDNTGLETSLFTPLTWISIDVADSNLHPLLFLRSPMHCVRLSIIHIALGFISPNILPICVTIMLALAIFQEWIWMEVSKGKCLNSIRFRHMDRQFNFNLIVLP